MTPAAPRHDAVGHHNVELAPRRSLTSTLFHRLFEGARHQLERGLVIEFGNERHGTLTASSDTQPNYAPAETVVTLHDQF